MKIQQINNCIYFSAKVKYDLLPKNDLLTKIQQGYTQNEIAQEFNVPKHVIVRSLKTYCIEVRKIKHGERRIKTLNRDLDEHK